MKNINPTFKTAKLFAFDKHREKAIKIKNFIVKSNR